MSRILADGDLSATNAKCKTFVRYTRWGLVLVRSWYGDNTTEVTAVIGAVHYRQWYFHGVITTRAAALLVNRFLTDCGVLVR